MRITYFIGGLLVLIAVSATPVVQASEGPNVAARGRVDNSGPGRADIKTEDKGGGSDSLRDLMERNAGFTSDFKAKGEEIRKTIEERSRAIKADLRARGTGLTGKTDGRRSEVLLLTQDDDVQLDTNVSGTRSLRGTIEDLKARMGTKRQEFQLRAEAKSEEFRAMIEAKRGEIKAMIETRKAELKARLEAFKDTTKGEIAARIDKTLGGINERWVAAFTASIDRIDGVLEAIGSRADKAEAAGKDVTDVRAKIDSAATAIASARAAIEAQATKDYTLTVQSEETVKTDASGTRDRLKEDLSAVRTAVRAAFDATKDAAKALRTIPGIEAETEVEASTSVQ